MELLRCVNDVSFGPAVEGCRGNFDFTLKFEKIILSILPSAIFIALSVPRGIYLVRRPIIVGGTTFRFTKIVCFHSAPTEHWNILTNMLWKL